MRITFDPDANAAYVSLGEVTDGAVVENVVVGRAGMGDVVLDFDSDGRLVGVEVIGARELLAGSVLARAERA